MRNASCDVWSQEFGETHANLHLLKTHVGHAVKSSCQKLAIGYTCYTPIGNELGINSYTATRRCAPIGALAVATATPSRSDPLNLPRWYRATKTLPPCRRISCPLPPRCRVHRSDRRRVRRGPLTRKVRRTRVRGHVANR